jgi:hypothetical protein
MTKHAELERLRCAPGLDVLVPSRAHEPEPRAESLSKSFGVIAFHGQTATLFRTIWSECRDDRVAARLEGSGQPGEVGRAVRLGNHKVERRAVVPDVIGPRWLLGRDVGDDPLDALGFIADPLFGRRQGRGRQIQYRQVQEAPDDVTVALAGPSRAARRQRQTIQKTKMNSVAIRQCGATPTRAGTSSLRLRAILRYYRPPTSLGA